MWRWLKALLDWVQDRRPPAEPGTDYTEIAGGVNMAMVWIPPGDVRDGQSPELRGTGADDSGKRAGVV